MGTHYPGTPAEVRALDAYIKLMRAADAVNRRLEPRLARHGLTETQFGVLETVFHLGSLLQRELAAKQLTSASNLTAVVDHLERAGLVARRRDPTDRRRTPIDLTPKGRALIRKIFPGHVTAIVREFAVLTPAEQVELGRLCKKLGLRQAQVAGRRRASGERRRSSSRSCSR